jgi:signal transduction histidine kinase
MRDVLEWMRDATAEYTSAGMSAVTHRTERLTVDDGAPIHVPEDGQGRPIGFLGSSTESTPGATLLACEPGVARLPLAEEMIPMAHRPRIDGNVVHNSDSPVRARILDSDACDITASTRSARQARLRVQQLATVNGCKEEFLAILSHELRSPLAAIQNAAYLLGSQPGQTPARQRAQALIERQVRRMNQLVDDLLDVSRINHGRLHLECERIDLRVVASNAIETLESDINERHQQLITALPDAPVWLRADPWRLEQVFVNLLTNASKYTDAGGVLGLWVHTRAAQAVVHIRDSGMGIAPDDLPHIFDLFRQADEAAPRSKSGLGIGLALVRTLVELHGGSVTAASAGSERGSEFTVRLPREIP